MMRLEREFVQGPGRIAAYLRICVSAYLRICVSAYLRICVCVYVYAGARMHKKTRGLDRAFFCLETD